MLVTEAERGDTAASPERLRGARGQPHGSQRLIAEKHFTRGPIGRG